MWASTESIAQHRELVKGQVRGLSTIFKRERASKMGVMVFYEFVIEVTSYHSAMFCLLGASQAPAHAQVEGIPYGHECQGEHKGCPKSG